MKYYIINITDEYYGCEFISSVLAIGNDKTINDKANTICSEWYSEDDPAIEDADGSGSYEQVNGCTTYVQSIKEISKSTFEDLQPILGQL
jgi:hypothetical protein